MAQGDIDEDLVLLERPADGVVLLRLNRPEVLNALSISVRLTLAARIRAVIPDEGVRAIVITGNEKAFAAGADLAELRKRTVRDASSPQSRAAWDAMRAFDRPIIAAVNGFALGGGCELALGCDIVIAGERAKFGLPEVKVGIMPGAGGTQRLVRAVGKYKAARYLLTGDMIPAAVASAIGIVSEVVPDEEVVAHAVTLAGKIASLPPLAVAALKEVIALGPDAPLDVALSLERKAFQVLFTTEDRNEGIDAFLEKRQPVFQGR